jgi:hypothetical protein
LPLASLCRLYLASNGHEALRKLLVVPLGATLERLHASPELYRVKHVLSDNLKHRIFQKMRRDFRVLVLVLVSLQTTAFRPISQLTKCSDDRTLRRASLRKRSFTVMAKKVASQFAEVCAADGIVGDGLNGLAELCSIPRPPKALAQAVNGRDGSHREGRCR